MVFPQNRRRRDERMERKNSLVFFPGCFNLSDQFTLKIIFYQSVSPLQQNHYSRYSQMR